MSVLMPLGLLALLALPVIIVLHLLRERRRRVLVPSLLLWQLLPPRREAQRRRRLPLTLLLLLHLLAAALLALALAQPQVSLRLFRPTAHTALVLDTSTSMAAPARSGTRLDAARARAESLIREMGGQDEVTLITAGPRPRLLDAAGPQGAARLLVALSELRAGGTGTDLVGAITLAEAALQGQSDARIIVLTDAAFPPTLLTELEKRPVGLPLSWEQVGGQRDNRAVVNLAARQRGVGGPMQVYARAMNYGQNTLLSVLRLFGDDVLLDTRSVSLTPGGESEQTWTVPRGVKVLRAELDGEDDLPADDVATISLEQTRPLKALVVSAQPSALERALRAVPGLTLTTLTPGLYAGSSEAAAADLTIFDGYLPSAWPPGSVLVVNPPAGSALLEVEEQPQKAGTGDEALVATPASAKLLDGVSLSSVEFGALPTVKPPDWATTLLSRGEQPLILRGRSDQSEITVWAFDLSKGNLTTRLAFPLLLVRSVRDLTPPALPAAVLLGETPQFSVDPRATRVEVGAPDGTVRVLTTRPGEPLALSLDQPGVYKLVEANDERTLFTSTLAVNAGAAIESDLTPRQLPRPTTSAQTRHGLGSEQPLWPWLAGVALVVMLGEWAYIHGRPQALSEV